ncbi:MAG: 2-oxo acid dehydrogenase subunit E2, partial [Candidatus Omnitrophica bacterium]|nr:2-oxo acid dehydrogenase subunit E2 [Candidatus Omnitrophota bacterium]
MTGQAGHLMDIKIPFLAEGVETGTVVSILVAEGGKVRKDQTLLELETNKATAPIPSPVAGTISKILVQEGDEVSVGQAVIRLREEGTSQGKPSKEKTAPSQEPKRTVSQEKPATQSEGYQYQSKSGLPPPASPSVRKMAVDLGIDLARVRGTERGGRISVNDLKAYIQSLEHVAPRASQKAAPSAPSIDFSKWGPVSRQAISSIRRTIGQKMYESWTTIPHVTQFAEADITSLLALRKKFAPFYEKKGARLTVTGIILKAVVEVLKKYPKFNASLDEAKNDLVLKNYYHLGVAVDTEQGLL